MISFPGEQGYAQCNPTTTPELCASLSVNLSACARTPLVKKKKGTKKPLSTTSVQGLMCDCSGFPAAPRTEGALEVVLSVLVTSCSPTEGRAGKSRAALQIRPLTFTTHTRTRRQNKVPVGSNGVVRRQGD